MIQFLILLLEFEELFLYIAFLRFWRVTVTFSLVRATRQQRKKALIFMKMVPGPNRNLKHLIK